MTWDETRERLKTFPAATLRRELELRMVEDETVDGRPSSYRAWKWLASTRVLQREVYNHDWDKIHALGPDEWNRALGESIRDNVTSLVAELGELLQELGPIWKTWVTNGRLSSTARDAAVEEVVDVAHFVANILVALDVDDDEWERLYRAKQEKNRARQAQPAGYDGVTGKCPNCKRSYDGAGVECRPSGLKTMSSSMMKDPHHVIEMAPYCSVVNRYV